MAKPPPKKLKVLRDAWTIWQLEPVLRVLTWDDGEQVWRDVETGQLEWEADQVWDTKLACVLACRDQTLAHLDMLQAVIADLQAAT